MSLEKALADNTAALIANTAALLGMQQTPATPTQNKKATDKPAPEKTPAANKPAGEAPAKDAAPTYADAAKVVGDMVQDPAFGRSKALEILGELGLAKLTDIKDAEKKPGQYAEVIAAFNKVRPQ